MGRTFDPKQHQGDGGGGGGNWLRVAGEYLLVIKRFKRDRAARSRKPFLDCTFVVIHGPMKDKRFTSKLYINDASLWKLGRLCEAMDYAESFDLDEDRSVRDAICNRPFLGKVTVRNGDKPDMKFAELDAPLTKVTDAQIEIMNAWCAEYEANREADGGDDFSDGPPPDDGDDPGPGDDDIPF